MSESLEVAYTTTIDDYVAYCTHTYKKMPFMRAVFVLTWIVIPLAIGCFAKMASRHPDNREATYALAAMAVLFAVGHPFLHRWWITSFLRSYAKKLGSRGVIGPIRLILTDESLVEITETTRSEVRWRDMAGVDEVGDYIFIMVTGMSAAIVPRHGFDREEDFWRVRDFVRRRLGTRG
jgi:hypothetical protein